MHIEIDKDNKQIVLTFVGTNEKEIYEKMENIQATLETKYDGETKVILRSRLYVEGDEKEFDKFEKVKPYSIGCENAQQEALTYKSLCIFNEEEDTSLRFNVETPDFASMKPKYVVSINPVNMDYLKIDLKWIFSNPPTSQHGKRFQRLRQKQYFKKR